MAQSLFIYWHVSPDQQAAAEAAARAFQSYWRGRHPTLVAHLFRRHDTERGRVTLMESYACRGGLPPELLAALQADGRAQLDRWAASGRHEELFEAAD